MSPRQSYLTTLDLLRKQQRQLAKEMSQLETVINGLDSLANGGEAVPGSEDEPHEVLPEHPPVGQYSQMEFIPAALHFLRSVGIPQTTQEIADALVAKGFRTRSKDFKNTAQALLKRAMDAGCPLHRTGRSTWEVRAS